MLCCVLFPPWPGVNEPEIMYFIRCIFDWHQNLELKKPFGRGKRKKGRGLSSYLSRRVRRWQLERVFGERELNAIKSHKRMVIERVERESERENYLIILELISTLFRIFARISTSFASLIMSSSNAQSQRAKREAWSSSNEDWWCSHDCIMQDKRRKLSVCKEQPRTCACAACGRERYDQSSFFVLWISLEK